MRILKSLLCVIAVFFAAGRVTAEEPLPSRTVPLPSEVRGIHLTLSAQQAASASQPITLRLILTNRGTTNQTFLIPPLTSALRIQVRGLDGHGYAQRVHDVGEMISPPPHLAPGDYRAIDVDLRGYSTTPPPGTYTVVARLRLLFPDNSEPVVQSNPVTIVITP